MFLLGFFTVSFGSYSGFLLRLSCVSLAVSSRVSFQVSSGVPFRISQGFVQVFI